ncbi:MAG: adenosylmethionine--8-amino-7-oxononanoate transaminase [Bacteroidota bacterium]|jgi:adenosylmethionine-8-amino-7-oxononanoate aminotransferase
MDVSNWKNKDAAHVWHPFTQVKTEAPPLQVVKAEGSLLFTADGRSYIDCNSSWWVNIHGHGNAHIGKAISEQFQRIDQVIFAGVTHQPAVELATRLTRLLHPSLQKVFFSDNGSTAVEVALKMAMQYFHNRGENRTKIMALNGAYHGDTFGAMSVGERDMFNRPFEPFFFEVNYLPFPEADKEAEILEKAAHDFATGAYLCLILEPLIQGSAGMRIYSVDFLEKLTRLAQENEVLVIYDEVMTAFGRTGKLFAYEHTEVVPDMICLSKGLTGGVLPMGLTVTTNAIFEAFLDDSRVKAFLHGHSFTGNPLACAAANASLDLFENSETWQNIERITHYYQEHYKRIAALNRVQEVRQLGTIFAVELTAEDGGYFAGVRDEIYHYFLENGCLMRPLGNVLYFNPPYSTTDSQLETMFRTLIAFLEKN